jgi:hypothetical protein
MKKAAEPAKEIPKLKIGQLSRKQRQESQLPTFDQFAFKADETQPDEYADELKRIQDTMKQIQMLEESHTPTNHSLNPVGKNPIQTNFNPEA